MCRFCYCETLVSDLSSRAPPSSSHDIGRRYCIGSSATFRRGRRLSLHVDFAIFADGHRSSFGATPNDGLVDLPSEHAFARFANP